jgi:DNA polymerase family A
MHVFDIESDGFVDKMTRIHCIVIKSRVTQEITVCNDQNNGRTSIEDGLRFLMDCDDIGGHNVEDFDIPAIQKLYPWFKPKGNVWDSLVISRLIWADLKDKDFKFVKKPKGKNFPMYLIGRHSMEAWGQRTGCPKDDYSKRMKEAGLDPWAEWNQMMEDYCVQDVLTNEKLFDLIDKKDYSIDSIQLEQDVWNIIRRQMAYGFMFDTKKAASLYAQLVDRKGQLTTKLQSVFHPFYVKNGETLPKKSMKKWEKHPKGSHERKNPKTKEIEKGFYHYMTATSKVMDRRSGEHVIIGGYCKIKVVEFNPGSRDHIANRLKSLYKWKPKVFTDAGKPQVDESIMNGLKFPNVKLLTEYLLISKRIGQLAEGNEAWLKRERNGRIHGRVNTNGAVTGRMTHNRPNVAQTPAGYSPYGKECRELFTVPTGKKLVGMDADALELRCLAGYMAKWDDGEYIEVVLNGTKEAGTDIHTRNMHAIGIKSRDDAKTWFYAYIYGAGDYKLGTIIAESLGKTRLGKKALINIGLASRNSFQKNLPALGKLVKAVKRKAKAQGWLKGLDGRRIPVRSEHAALNTLLQSAGAVLMKKCLVMADKAAQACGWSPGVDFEWVANIHDEVQVEVNEEIANEFGNICTEALLQAGKSFEFRCPITGSFDVGNNWAETH